MMRTDITKTPMYLLKSKKTLSTLEQYCILIGMVILIMWLLRTNKITILLWRRKYMRALGNTVFLMVRLVMWLLRTNQSIVLLWRRKCFLAQCSLSIHKHFCMYSPAPHILFVQGRLQVFKHSFFLYMWVIKIMFRRSVRFKAKLTVLIFFLIIDYIG